MNGMKEILIIRWKSIGDVVFTLPAVNCIRANFPSARLTFLVSRENAFVVEGFAAIDQVWTIDRALLRGSRFLHGTGALTKLVFRIRRQRFSLVVDLQGYGETALISRVSGAEDRWGRTARSLRSRAYTRRHTPDNSLHPARDHLNLLAEAALKSGPTENQYRLDARDRLDARAFLQGRGFLRTNPLVYLQPFTSSAAKNWPLDRHLQVASILEDIGVQVIFGGGPEDRELLRTSGVDSRRIVEGVPRRTDIALLECADLVIGGDTGFLHLAVALKTQVLLLGRHSAVTPLGHPEQAILSPGPRVDSITVDEVVQKIGTMLKVECGALSEGLIP
jgi:ADP-heptose:LPS heptosyltransferase